MTKKKYEIELRVEQSVDLGVILMRVVWAAERGEWEGKKGRANRLSADHWQFDCNGE